MIRIGVTGGIGSGKSVVCAVFRQLGVHVYNADLRARSLMNHDPYIIHKLVARFGESVYSNNELNRAFLAEIIFNDRTAIEFVNSVVHPAVADDFETWCAGYPDESFVLEESALLFESGAYRRMDKTVTVFAPEYLRLQRVVLRDHLSAEHIKSRMNNQMPEEEKLKLTDFIIYNDEKRSVLEQVFSLYNLFKYSDK